MSGGILEAKAMQLHIFSFDASKPSSETRTTPVNMIDCVKARTPKDMTDCVKVQTPNDMIDCVKVPTPKNMTDWVKVPENADRGANHSQRACH